jgi:hypothetical protein
MSRLAIQDQPGGITVSTLAEADYFFAQGITEHPVRGRHYAAEAAVGVQAECRGRPDDPHNR